MTIKNITVETFGLHVGEPNWSRLTQGVLSKAGTLTCGGMSIFGDCSDIGGIASVTIGTADGDSLQKNKKLSLHVKGNTVIKGDRQTDSGLSLSGGKVQALFIEGDTKQGGTFRATGEVFSNNGAHLLSNKKNLPFDMPHPSKKGWRLRHVCIEGPEIAVYCRGRVKNEKVIRLPSYWKDLVNIDSLSVQLTPIGSHQNIIVKRWDEEFVYLQNQGGLPINCFYHIIAQRVDDDLVVEYEGETHEDYPGGNESYSFNWESSHVEKLIKEATREKLKELGIDKSDSPASKNDF